MAENNVFDTTKTSPLTDKFFSKMNQSWPLFCSLSIFSELLQHEETNLVSNDGILTRNLSIRSILPWPIRPEYSPFIRLIIPFLYWTSP